MKRILLLAVIFLLINGCTVAGDLSNESLTAKESFNKVYVSSEYDFNEEIVSGVNQLG